MTETSKVIKKKLSRNQRGLITDSAIRKLPHRANEYCLYDTKLNGYFVRVRPKPSDRKTYAVKVRLFGVGKPVYDSIGSTNLYSAVEARKKAKEKIQLIHDGVHPKEAEAKARLSGSTMTDLLEDYAKRKKLKEKTIQGYKSILNSVLSKFSHRDIKDITHQQITAWYTSLERDKETSANRGLSVFKACFNSAVNLELIEPNDNPMLKLDVTRYEAIPRETILKDKLLIRWLLAFLDLGATHYNEGGKWKPHRTFKENQHTKKNKKVITEATRDYILFLLLTGSRSTELKLLQWEDVNMDEETITYKKETTKSNRPLTLPLTYTMLLILNNRLEKNQDSKYVFPPQSKLTHSKHLANANRVFKAISDASKMPRGITAHDLRHTFMWVARYKAKYLIDDEWHRIGTDEISALVNHQVSLQRGYTGEELEEMRLQLDAVGYWLSSSIPLEDRGTGNITYFSGLFDWVFYHEDENYLLDQEEKPKKDRPLDEFEKFKVEMQKRIQERI
jgi:integrase